jgi:isocitrate dehydrogenase (NAD+)
VRENTEDLYAGIEFERGTAPAGRLRDELRELAGYDLREDAGVTVKPISVTGTRRIVRFAFDHAVRNSRRRVTVGHKANIMKFSDGVFLRTAGAEATAYPDVEFEAVQVDELAMRLAWEPETFDVLLLPNLYGDIVSDLCAGLVGGLGLAAGANLGWEYAVFEPVHGSAPDIAGKGLADPVAMIGSAAMMLRHLSERHAAEAVERAVADVLSDGAHVTPDLGGNATTGEMAGAIARAARAAGRARDIPA